MAEEFYLNSAYTFEIGDDDTTINVLGAGLSNVDPQMNEEVDQTPYLDGDGFSTSDVTGGQVTYAFTGHRLYGDAAQDYIFSKQYTFGSARRCYFSVTSPNGETLTGPATIANMSGPSGEANTKGEISFEIHFNGKPVHTEPPVV